MKNPPLPSNIDTSPVEMYEEARRYFMGKGRLNKSLARLASDLEDHGIDYMVIGAVAMLAHGYPRFTRNIDLVMTADGLKEFRGSTIDRMSIEVLTAGEYPGDGKPKPVSIPDPATASTRIDGIKFVTLEKLIELKLASGISAPHRLKDLADVQELIKIKKLDAGFANKLDPYVRAKYLELQDAVSKSEDVEE